jgi:very-short-patch-repair endonuclease
MLTISDNKSKTPPPAVAGYSSIEENFTPGRLRKYKNLPYNSKLKEKAKKLRKSGNLSEALLWDKVKNKQLLNLDFQRQKIIGNYIVDFYSAALGLIVEIDGQSHDFKGEYDNVRDKYLRNLGLKVVHVEDIRIKKDLDCFMAELYGFVYLLKHVKVKTPRPASQSTPSCPTGRLEQVQPALECCRGESLTQLQMVNIF